MSPIKNNMQEIKSLQKSQDKEFIKELLLDNFHNNFDEEFAGKLANLLVIDHFYRLNSIPTIHIHMQQCIFNLKNYLGMLVIEDTSFSSVMTLFAAAISHLKSDFDDGEQILFESQDAVIDSLIRHHYSDIDENLFEEMKAIFYEIVDFIGIVDLVKSVNKNPVILKSKIEQMVEDKTNYELKMQELFLEMQRQSNLHKQQNIENLKKSNMQTKILLSVASIGTVPIFLSIGSFVLSSLFVVPSVVLSYATERIPKLKNWLKDEVNDEIISTLQTEHQQNKKHSFISRQQIPEELVKNYSIETKNEYNSLIKDRSQIKQKVKGKKTNNSKGFF